MLLNQEDKLLVIHRRNFENDSERFFLGTVQGYESGIVKIKGYTFVRDSHTTLIKRKNEERTRIMSLSTGNFVYLLPSTTDISKLRFEADPKGSLYLMEGERNILDLTEAPHRELDSNHNLP